MLQKNFIKFSKLYLSENETWMKLNNYHSYDRKIEILSIHRKFENAKLHQMQFYNIWCIK